MAKQLNRRAYAFAAGLIEAGTVETGDQFELTLAERDQLLEKPGRYYLAEDPGQEGDDEVRYSHPVGKFVAGTFFVFQSALAAIAELEVDNDAVRQAAEDLLGLLDLGEIDGSQAEDEDAANADEITATADGEDAPDGGGGNAGGSPPVKVNPQQASDDRPRTERFAGESLERALIEGNPKALAQVRADMRARREVVGEKAVREVFGTNVFRRTYSTRKAEIDREARTVRMSFSSEEPYQRWSWDGPYIEVLGHNTDEVDLSRLRAGGAYLVNHNTDDQVGVIIEADIGSDRKGRALVKLSRSARAEEILVDLEDGIRPNTSVGYTVDSMKLVEEHDDAPDVYRARWTPLEISTVAVPADPTVGLGRDAELELASRDHTQESKTMPGKNREFMAFLDGAGNEGAGGGGGDPVAIATKSKQEGQKIERERIAGILALGKAHNLPKLATEHVEKGTELDAFRREILTAIADGAGQPTRNASRDDEIGLTPNEARSFSFIKALRAVFAREGFEKFGRSDIDAAGFELECSAAVGEHFGQDAKGILIPLEIMRTPLIDPRQRAAQQLMQYRDVNAASDPAGGYLIDEEMLAMVPMLRNLSLLLSMGATGLGGLVGDVSIPRHVSGSTTYWLNENGEPTESDPVFAKLGLSPHTVGATTDVTRRMLKQSSQDMEHLVRQMLMGDLSVEIDRVGINGSGASGEPLGILNTSGIGSVADSGGNGSATDWADVVNVFKELALDNVRANTLGWLTSVEEACKLMTTLKDGTNLPYIMDGFDEKGFTRLMGLRCGVTNNVPSNLVVGSGTGLSALLCGNFPDLVIAQWGTIDITADKSAKVLSGGLRVVALADVDTGCRRPQSFSAKADCITT